MKNKYILPMLFLGLCMATLAQNTPKQIPALQLNVDSLGNIKIIPLNKEKSKTESSYNFESQRIVHSQQISKTSRNETFFNQNTIKHIGNQELQNKTCINTTKIKNRIQSSNEIGSLKWVGDKINSNPNNKSECISNSTMNVNYNNLENLPNTNNSIPQPNSEPKGKPNIYVYTGIGAFNLYTFNAETGILNIYNTIANNGSSPAYFFRIGYYLSTNKYFGSTDKFIGGNSIDTLDYLVYKSSQISVDLDNIDIPSGTYYIFIVCDDTYAVSETSESDNEQYFTSPITYTKDVRPNLQLYTGEGTTNAYSYSDENKLLSLSASIINSGIETAYDFNIGFYLSTDIPFDTTDVRVAEINVASLAAGYVANTETLTYLSDKGLLSGTYYIIIVCDDTYKVNELNENDNFNYFIEPITYTEPVTVDIFVYTGENSNNSYTYNDATKQLDINASIANGGNSSADTFLVAFCLSLNEVLDTNDIFVGIDTIPYLESLYFTAVESSIVLGDLELPSGTYYVYIICDIGAQITETNENNNVEHFIDPIVYTEPSKTNLFVYRGDGSKNEYTFDNATHILQLYASTGNVGNTTAPNFRVGFYLSSNTAIDNTDKLIESVAISSLEFNHYKNIETSTDLDDLDIPAGIYYIIIYCDDLFQITETDETDNGAYFDQSISFTPTEVLNICIYKGKEAQNNCNYDASTHELDISASIENVGNTTAKDFRIGLYLSSDATIKTSDTHLDDVTISSLENGKFKNIEFSVDLDNLSIASGVYYIGVLCDDLNKIDEASETDNGFCFNNTIEYNPTSIDEDTQTLPFIIYPNPTGGILAIVPNEQINTELVISILGFNGMVFETFTLPKLSVANQYSINLSSYKSGMYFIKINNEKVTTIKRVIKI